MQIFVCLCTSANIKIAYIVNMNDQSAMCIKCINKWY